MRTVKMFFVVLATLLFGCTNKSVQCECKDDLGSNYDLAQDIGNHQDLDSENHDPLLEICDGIDNNGDGQIDEDYPEKEIYCLITPEDSCLRRGLYKCRAGHLNCHGVSFNPPRNLTIRTISCGEIMLTWETFDQEGHQFAIQRKSNQDNVYHDIAVVDADARSYSDQNAQSNITYSYMIRGISEQGDSSCTFEQTTTTADINVEEIMAFDEQYDQWDFRSNKSSLRAVIDSQSNYHLIFCNPNDHYGLYHAVKSDGIWNFEHIQQIGCASLSLNIDNNDKLHLLNYQGCGGGSNPDLYYQTNQDGTWRTNRIDWFAWNDCVPNGIFIDNNNVVHFVYEAQNFADGRIRYVFGNFGSWSNIPAMTAGQYPRIIKDNNDIPYIYSKQDEGYLIIRYNEGLWEEIDNDFTIEEGLKLQFDKDNILHAFHSNQHSWLDQNNIWQTEELPFNNCNCQLTRTGNIVATCTKWKNVIIYINKDQNWIPVSLGNIFSSTTIVTQQEQPKIFAYSGTALYGYDITLCE